MKRLGILIVLIFGFQMSAIPQETSNTDQLQIKEAIDTYFVTMWELDNVTYVEEFNHKGPNSSSYFESEVLKNYSKYQIDKINLLSSKGVISNSQSDQEKAEVKVYFDTYEGGGFSHCGMKIFKLSKSLGDWRIKSVESFVHPEVCPEIVD
ncbi:hypothetical protein GZ212_09420 [Mangrovimonas sp. CR14]|uniref:hypothetical protein n=1 Tax=Mangrovimonas sp. CR14 TaxID=2706120 RepID=UPI0014241112|nr:hypothetical protein [Mangrovimonas sp. CR14]NIK92369.1 hypothetical protein [Mangrovimonas sp. CR14]